MNVDFIQAIKLFFANYVNFKGRSTRAEFWWAMLFLFLLSLVCDLISSYLSTIAALAVCLPAFAITVRRLHDINRAGWWLIIYYIIVFTGGIAAFWGLGVFSSELATLPQDQMILELTQKISSGDVPSLGAALFGYAIILFAAIVYLVWMAKPSGPDNEYGPNPYGTSEKI